MLLMTAIVSSCGGGGGGDKPDGPITPSTIAVSSVSLSKTEADLVIGNTLQLTATVNPSNATEKTVTWTSSNTTVATVTPTGLITAKAEGSSNITASCGGKSATCKITVKKPTVAVTSVELDKTEITLDADEIYTLKATVKPDDATDKTVTWASSKTDVAIVDNNGKVTGVNNGVASITATSGGKSASCKVNVVVTVKSVSLSQTTATIAVGQDPLTLTATVSPANAADKTVTWISSNPSVATVNNGVVTAIDAGITTITAEASGMTAACEVTVTIPVESISLNKPDLALDAGASETLVVTINPSNATEQSISWESSEPTVATVDGYGKVTGLDNGVSIIKATCGGKSATCTVTVTVQVTSVSLSHTSITIAVGQEPLTLIAIVLPDNAANKSVTWISSDTSVATIDNSGKVEAKAPGTTFITAICSEKKAICRVIVMKPGGLDDTDSDRDNYIPEEW